MNPCLHLVRAIRCFLTYPNASRSALSPLVSGRRREESGLRGTGQNDPTVTRSVTRNLGFYAVPMSKGRALRVKDVAAYLRVSHQRGTQMYAERKLPEPQRIDSIGPLWKSSTIERWAEWEWWGTRNWRSSRTRRPGVLEALPRGGLIGERARAEPRGKRLGQPRRPLEHDPSRVDELVERDATEVPLDQRLGVDRHDQVFG